MCGCPLVTNVFEETGDFCRASKRTCLKHYCWEKLRRAEIDLQRIQQVRLCVCDYGVFNRSVGGGGGCSPKFYTGSLRPEVHTLLWNIFDRKVPWVPETFLTQFPVSVLRRSWLRPSANTENFRRTREKPLVPRKGTCIVNVSSTDR